MLEWSGHHHSHQVCLGFSLLNGMSGGFLESALCNMLSHIKHNVHNPWSAYILELDYTFNLGPPYMSS
jgi:hypothetical protein